MDLEEPEKQISSFPYIFGSQKVLRILDSILMGSEYLYSTAVSYKMSVIYESNCGFIACSGVSGAGIWAINCSINMNNTVYS